MTLKEIKKELNLSDADIAEAFGFKNANSYRNGKQGKKRLDAGLVWFYELLNNHNAPLSENKPTNEANR